jgi:hypothetical protein
MGRYSQGYLVHMLDLEVNEWVLCADTAETHAEIRGLRPGHLYRYILYCIPRKGLQKTVSRELYLQLFITCQFGTATKRSTMFMSLNVASLNVIVSKRKSFKT